MQAGAKIDGPRYAVQEVKKNTGASLPMHLEPINKLSIGCTSELIVVKSMITDEHSPPINEFNEDTI